MAHQELTMANLKLAAAAANNQQFQVQDSQNMALLGLPQLPEQAERKISPGTLSQASLTSMDSCHLEEAEPQGLMHVTIRAPTLKRTHSMGKQEMPQYRMTSQPRGLALIVANEKYQNGVQDERIGSDIDRKNLTALFENLGFGVEQKLNLSKRQLLQTLAEFAEDERHATADMMVLIVLSHGWEGVIFTSDGLKVELERVFEQFNNQGCPKLKGKPKFFIMQACRGSTKDFGTFDPAPDVSSPGTTPTTTTGPEIPPPRRRRTRGDALAHSPSTSAGAGGDALPYQLSPRGDRRVGHLDLSSARPTWEDMVIAYSTLPGFISNRDHETGTWFVQSLVEVFMNHAADYELVDLLRMTSQRLSQFENESREKQTCNIEMRGLYKRLYFNPQKFAKKRAKLDADNNAQSGATCSADHEAPVDWDITESEQNAPSFEIEIDN